MKLGKNLRMRKALPCQRVALALALAVSSTVASNISLSKSIMLAKAATFWVAAVLLFDGGLCDCYCDEFREFSC